MDDQNSKRSILQGIPSGRLRDQPLLPLPPASSADGPASLSIAIQTALPPPQNDRDTPERRYVRAVLARYLWLPDTPGQSSRHDRRLAHALYERGVPLLVVEAALLLAAARRALREPWLAPLPRVRSMHYYLPVVAELLDIPREPDLDYLICLLRRLRPLAELKQARLRHQAQYAKPPATDAARGDRSKGKAGR
ncbi:MAG: hypothetical protein ACREXU_05045 [Gammaproteobacteria bacterium]